MKQSRVCILLQYFFRWLPRRALSLIALVFSKPIFGLCNGYWMEFDLGEEIQKNIYVGKYEPVQTGWVKRILKPGGAFLDVGANVGYFTTLAARLVGKAGAVFAFEPSPYAYKRLASILKQNSITQVSAFQSAVGDKEEFLDLYLPNDNCLHSPSLVASDKLFTPVKVAVCRLDDHAALQSGLRIDLMKVDVEGFEPNVFRGYAQQLKAGRVKYLICEFNSGWLEPNGSSFAELFKIISDLGFIVCEQTPKITLTGHQGLIYQQQDILFKHRSVKDNELGSSAG